MEATRTFRRCLFDAPAIRDAREVFEALARGADATVKVWQRQIAKGHDRWQFDDDDEFFAEYSRGFTYADFRVSAASDDAFDVHAVDERHMGVPPYTNVRVVRPTRGEIERVLAVFGDRADAARVLEPPPPPPPPPPRPTVFIGHGRSVAWKDLKDHLRDKHGYEIEAYETGARAGHTIRDILEAMLDRSTFAVLVLTAEDVQAADGEGSGAPMRARQNVVHETGLFQGRLGWHRAIVAVEDGVELFSNLDGIQQLRFSPGHIDGIFGEVLATLRREFPASAS